MKESRSYWKVFFTSGARLGWRRLSAHVSRYVALHSTTHKSIHKACYLLLLPLPPQNHIALIMAQAPQAQGYEHDDAWDVNWLRVDETHELYYEQYGLKDGNAGVCALAWLFFVVVNLDYSDLSSRSTWAERPLHTSTITGRIYVDDILTSNRVQEDTSAKVIRHSSTQNITVWFCLTSVGADNHDLMPALSTIRPGIWSPTSRSLESTLGFQNGT
jgi:hypothetical protein